MTSAADLPHGSIVANATEVWMKSTPTRDREWRATDGLYHSNWQVDEALQAGAQVLRDGYGDEGGCW